MKRIIADQCYECGKQIYVGEEYYTWNVSYCSKKCLTKDMKENINDVIDEVAELKIG